MLLTATLTSFINTPPQNPTKVMAIQNQRTSVETTVLSLSLSGTNTQFLNQKMYSQASYDTYNTIIYQSYKLLCHE